MDNFNGKKLNAIWEQVRKTPETISKALSEGLLSIAKGLESLAKTQSEQKQTLDKLLVISQKDEGKRVIEGVVSVKDLYVEIDKALKENKPKDIDYPELQKMFVALGEQIGESKLDIKALAKELASALPEQKELTIDKPIEIFGKTVTKLEGNSPKTPLYVSVVNTSDIKGGGSTTISQGGSIPDDLIESDGAGGRRLKVSPSAGGGGGGLTDAQLRATPVPVSGTITVANPTANPETGLAKDGSDITSPTAMPTGGVGIRGWLSAIWTKLNGTIAVTGTFFQATQPVSGTITANKGTGFVDPQTNALTDAQLRASNLAVNAAEKYTLLSFAKLLTADDVITPATGKRIQIVWCQIVPSSDNLLVNPVTLRLTINSVLTDIYKVYALGRTAVFTGDVNTPLVIDLLTAETVSVNIQYREIT